MLLNFRQPLKSKLKKILLKNKRRNGVFFIDKICVICYIILHAEVSERSNVHAWKACVVNSHLGFESRPLRHTKIVALKAHFRFVSSRGQAQFLFMRPDENRHKRAPVKLFTISWEMEQTSDSGAFANSKLPKAPFVTPPQLPSEAEILRKRIKFIIALTPYG